MVLLYFSWWCVRLLCKNGNSGDFSMWVISLTPDHPLMRKGGGGEKHKHSYIKFEYIVRRHMYVEIEATQLFLIS